MQHPTVLIDALLVRGRAALAVYLAKIYTPVARPFAYETLPIVTTADFVIHTDACLEYAVTTRPLYILGASGAIVALLTKHHLPSPKAP